MTKEEKIKILDENIRAIENSDENGTLSKWRTIICSFLVTLNYLIIE